MRLIPLLTQPITVVGCPDPDSNEKTVTADDCSRCPHNKGFSLDDNSFRCEWEGRSNRKYPLGALHPKDKEKK